MYLIYFDLNHFFCSCVSSFIVLLDFESLATFPNISFHINKEIYLHIMFYGEDGMLHVVLVFFYILPAG